MELKNPSPLGEKKISEKSITEEFLEIARNEKIRKKENARKPLSILNIFKSNNNQEVHNTPQTQIKSKMSIKDISWNNIKLYISTHKEQVTNILLILIPLSILSIVVIVISTYTRAQPYRIANEFIQKIEEKDLSAAYSLTSDAYKAVTTEKEFKKVVDNLNTVDISNRRLKSRKIENLKDMGEYAYIKYRVSGSYLYLVIYNDTLDWRVHSIELTNIK